MKAVRLRTEYLKDPMGLGCTAPRFSWNCDGGITQTAWQIVCRRNGEVIWDSGRVASSAMTQIVYEGDPLRSRDMVDWTVWLWDENHLQGEPASGRFEMGLLETSDWKAGWIAGPYRPKKNTRYPVDCFRKCFQVSGEVRKARLYTTARGVYDVAINGRRIEDFILAPGMTDYRKRIQYQTIDVTDDIRDDNVIVLRLADGWYRGSVAAYGVTDVFGRQTSVMAQLELTMADGSVRTIGTDESWNWADDGPIRFADLKDGEIYDAAMQPSWRGRAVRVPAPQAQICASDNVPVMEHERFTPRLLHAQDGSAVLDFGQNIAGYLECRLHGRKGQKVRIVCGEILDKDGNVDLAGIQETIPARGWSQPVVIRKLLTNKVAGETSLTPRQEITILCSGGEDHYKTSFAVFGFRYAQIITDSDLKIDPADFTSIAVYSDMEETGRFCCSDARVNRFLDNTRWSMKSNFLDVPTDCPTRERLGWTGDAQIFFDTGAYLMDTSSFFAKWLRDMEDAQYPDGKLPAVVPYSGMEIMYKSTGTSVGWADAVYLVPWRYYLRYGDQRLLRRCWPMMKKYAAYLKKHLEKDGHYEKGVHLGEWLEPEEFREKKYGAGMKHPEECTAYLYLTMTTMAKIAAVLGEPDEYSACAERAKAVYRKYAELDTDRQAKLVRPLSFGLLDGAEKETARHRLVQAVEHFHYRVGTGFLSTPFLLPALTQAGEQETAYRVLQNDEKPGWLYEVKEGATTVWENWEGTASRNHYSPGAVCQWLFDTVCGIRQDGENHFLIRPVPGGSLRYAEAEYRSIYGSVVSRWEREDEKITYQIVIPPNTSADIVLPDGRTETVTAGTYCICSGRQPDITGSEE